MCRLPTVLRGISTPGRHCRAWPLINFMHDLLQNIWLPQSAWILISSSNDPKQPKIVLSPWFFTTSIHGSDQWPERNLFSSASCSMSEHQKTHIWCIDWVLGPLAAVNRFPMFGYTTTSLFVCATGICATKFVYFSCNIGEYSTDLELNHVQANKQIFSKDTNLFVT